VGERRNDVRVTFVPRDDEGMEVRDYTAVFTLEMPKGTDEAEWNEALTYLQDHFSMQWAQTHGSGTGWTVTIHPEDRI